MKLEIVKILKIKKESHSVRTFTLDKKFNAIPGQFAMLWIPDVGEKPFCFSRINKNLEITVKKRGKFTNEFFKLKKGNLIGIRGPYGNGFRVDVKAKNVCVISGGIGISPLMPLIEELRGINSKVIVILGAKTKNELLFIDRIKKTKAELKITTEDCTAGKGCFCTDLLPEVIKKEDIDVIYTCGPEIMMKKVMKIAEKFRVPCQISMERYMKCGIGICGNCALDPSGLLVCKDGPVFDSIALRNSEFGKYKRDASGGRIPI